MTNSSTLNIKLNFSFNDKYDFIKAFALIKYCVPWDVLACFNLLAEIFDKFGCEMFRKEVATIEHRVVDIGLDFGFKFLSQLVHQLLPLFVFMLFYERSGFIYLLNPKIVLEVLSNFQL